VSVIGGQMKNWGHLDVVMNTSPTKYDRSFYEFIDAKALESAVVVIPYVKQLLEIRSVIDFGCGQGFWLHLWQQSGVDAIAGVDGAYVDIDRLLFSPEAFVPHDLSTPIDLGRRFDLVQSLEVAEHISAECADTFIDNLARHGDVILFSAALPGQCGIQHVNERPFAYWRARFSRRGFLVFDPLRPKLLSEDDVAWWYRYGLLVYARESVLGDLP